MPDPAEDLFLASLPRGEKGDLIPGHTTWAMLGPKTQERYRVMAQAVIDSHTRTPDFTHLLLRDLVAYLTASGMTEVEAHDGAAKLVTKVNEMAADMLKG